MLAVSDCLVVGILHFFGQFRNGAHRVRNLQLNIGIAPTCD